MYQTHFVFDFHREKKLTAHHYLIRWSANCWGILMWTRVKETVSQWVKELLAFTFCSCRDDLCWIESQFLWVIRIRTSSDLLALTCSTTGYRLPTTQMDWSQRWKTRANVAGGNKVHCSFSVSLVGKNKYYLLSAVGLSLPLAGLRGCGLGRWWEILTWLIYIQANLSATFWMPRFILLRIMTA